MVKSLQVDDQDLGEPVNRQVLLNVDLPLALAALEASLNHPFGLDELFQTLLQLDAAKETNGLPRNLHAQVHEVVKGAVLKAAAETLRAVYQLAFEEVRHDGVVACFVVSAPLLRLLLNRHILEVELFVGGLLRHAVQFVVHPVDEEAHELLRVLLVVAGELRDCARHRRLDV